MDTIKEFLLTEYWGKLNPNEMTRELITTVIHGDYKPHAVMYCVQGSPPKGTVMVIPEYKTAYYYGHGKWKRLHGFFKYEKILYELLVQSVRILKEYNEPKQT